ncbi:MAG: argininosuccinate lyase [Thermomicrobiales bacterium]
MMTVNNDSDRTSPTGSSKAWGGRFADVPDARLEAFNASVAFDVRMIREDIRGSIAHARMLGACGIIAPDEATTLERGLWQVLDEYDRGEFALTIADEDVHTGVERRLREITGTVAGKLHTGRSRNDQVANDHRFWARRQLVLVADGLVAFGEALLTLAEQYPEAIMPGYTHLQRAQPVLVAHHLQAYVEMLLRDLERVRQAWKRTNVLVLGSSALAGTSYPIDREMVAQDLGYEGITMNSLDGVSDRDFVLDALYACSLIGMHISRLSEEIILWSSGEFRFLELADRFSTGSSIMPQKKNADIAELGRGKSGRLYGNLMAMLTIAKGLPLAYNKDMQEDKEGLQDSFDTILALLDVFPPMMQSARFNVDVMAAAAVADFTLATDAADVLAKQGVPFREAHQVIGSLVARCIAEGITFADLSDEQWADIHPVFAEERPPVDVWTSVSSRNIIGGTAPDQVEATRAGQHVALLEARYWVVDRLRVDNQLFERNA